MDVIYPAGYFEPPVVRCYWGACDKCDYESEPTQFEDECETETSCPKCEFGHLQTQSEYL